jgi:glycerol-3-phosphate O-acyltransferase
LPQCSATIARIVTDGSAREVTVFGSISIPVWLFALLLLIAGAVAFNRLLLPGMRLLLRKRVNRVIDEVNTRLHIELRPFQLTRRQLLIDRLVHDPKVMQTIDAQAREQNVPRDLLQARVRGYAKEIVPAFNAYFYFRIGYWLAKNLARRLYRVRVAQLDDTVLRSIDPNASVVFVMNHRSNMDYVLVAFLIAETTALSYAVGEWARIWPLRTLIRAMGAFFVRRNSADPLYRRVLERYVHMATREGVCQAVYPEGGLSRDGRMREPKLGFLGYMLRDLDLVRDRDIVFIPVGVNYDRTLEDRTLLRGLDPAAEPRGRAFALTTALRFIARNIALMLRSNWHRLGYASVAFGTPLSIREHYTQTTAGSDKPCAVLSDVTPFAELLMQRIAHLIPALPVAVVATVLVARIGKPLSRDELLDLAQRRIAELDEAGAVIGIPKSTQRYSVAGGLEMLVLRRIVLQRDDDAYLAPPQSREILAYYANSLHAFAD